MVVEQYHTLSPTQVELLFLWAEQGMTYSEIMAEKKLARSTVNTHMEAIRKRMGTSSLAEAYRELKRRMRAHSGT